MPTIRKTRERVNTERWGRKLLYKYLNYLRWYKDEQDYYITDKHWRRIIIITNKWFKKIHLWPKWKKRPLV